MSIKMNYLLTLYCEKGILIEWEKKSPLYQMRWKTTLKSAGLSNVFIGVTQLTQGPLLSLRKT